MVLVFKTNVRNKRAVSFLKPHLDQLIKYQKWNFDLNDTDRIFRVETDQVPVKHIQSLFRRLGYACEELPD